MLRIHFANHYETLTRLLFERLSGARGNVFAPDQLIVPSSAVRRSLTLALAEHQGVCANVQFSFLAQWLWQQIARLVPAVAEESPFAAPVLAWRVWAAFGEPDFVAAHPRLAAYLQGGDAVMRYQLAQRVAVLLELYLGERGDWLQDWLRARPAELHTTAASARQDERWQAELWQRITAEVGVDPLQPAARFIQALEQGGAALAASAGLPGSAHVFALPTMPQLHLQLLQALGRCVELHVYVLNPCREHWFELIDRRRLSHLAARGRAQAHEEGNCLLAAWGRQTQSHVEALVEICGDGAEDDGHFEAHGGPTLLAQLQDSILELRQIEPGSLAVHGDDRSVEVHVCHSLTRELEVLHDHLLGLFCDAQASGTPLQPSDILVVTPDLEAAAPLIDAVFGAAPQERRIPYTLSGRSSGGTNVAARALLALLSLVASRCAASEVFGLLQQAIVARRFGLDDDALQQLHDWMRDSGMRWGLDAAHRASFDVPAQARHTLGDGLERLFLGYALPAQATEPWREQLPCGDAEGSSAATLGAFWRYVDALQRLRAAVSVAQTPPAWVALLHDAIAIFVQPTDDELDDVRELQQAIRTLAAGMQRGGLAQGGAPAVPLAVLHLALAQALDDPVRGGVPSGSVTFTSMSSLRGLPFAVVCAIGLNDGSFPTAQRASEFDLMALRPRRSDRQRGSDERNLFLDLLLAARRSLYLSHTGRSARDNSPLPPSVLVSELLDLLVPAISDDPACAPALAHARRRLVVEHALQPFAVEAFAVDSEPRLRSFNRELGSALQHSLRAVALPHVPHAVALADDEADDEAVADPMPRFFGAALPAPGPEWREPTLAQLVEFFRNPCRYLLRRRLGIGLQRDAETLQDDEPFVPDWTSRNALARRLLPSVLQGADADSLRRLALAGIEWPAGALGTLALDRELQALHDFAARVRDASAAPCLAPHHVAIDIALDGEGWHLRAAFADLRGSGLVRWRYDATRAGDYLEAWLHHLALGVDAPHGVDPRTTWLSSDGRFGFEPCVDARALLRDLLRLYRRGLVEPLPFFPKSALQFVRSGREKAIAAWRCTAQHPHGEESDPAYRLALRGREEPLDAQFEACATAVFAPLLRHLVDARVPT
jgi:exodeoxyribonuclease V gamma subunit